MNTDLLRSQIGSLFKIDPVQFDQFVAFSAMVTLKKNEVFEGADKVAQLAGFVNKGILREYELKDGVEYIHEFYAEGSFIGNYISYQHQIPSTTITVAIEPCEIIRFTFETFEKFASQAPDGKRYSEHIAKQKEKALRDRATFLLTKTPEERYEHFIEHRGDLVNRVPQYHIAQYIGVTPISLSRIRKRGGKL